MANGVYHVGLGRVLNLTEPDLGHPDLPGLWDRLRTDKRPTPERGLQCIQCRQDRPDCPEWMFLSERLDGVRFSTHFTRGIKDHPEENESDQHKALKERIASVAEAAGFTAEVEDRASSGKRRTDVLVKGADGLLIGHEVQLSYAGRDSVRKRAKTALADGITPLWSTTNPKADWINHVPWARTADAPWRDINAGAKLSVLGGCRRLEMLHCSWLSQPCPDRKSGRCSAYHPTWQLPENGASGIHLGGGIQLDDLVRASAGGEFVPIAVPTGRSSLRMWVTPEDRDRWLDSGGVLLDAAESVAKRVAVAQHQEPEAIEKECRYGQDTGFRSPPSPDRDPGGGVIGPGVSAAQALDLPTPPPMVLIVPGICRRMRALDERCGQAAHLYPGGWLCDDHKP